MMQLVLGDVQIVQANLAASILIMVTGPAARR